MRKCKKRSYNSSEAATLVSKFELLQLQGQLNDVLSEDTQHCLQDGPKMNSIGGCMFLFLNRIS